MKTEPCLRCDKPTAHRTGFCNECRIYLDIEDGTEVSEASNDAGSKP